MIARPVTAAIECSGCRNAIFRAVLSRPAAPSLGLLAQRGIRQAPPPLPTCPSTRFFSTAQALKANATQDTNAAIEPQNETEEAIEKELSEDTPWFLEVDPPRHPPIHHAVDLPKVPEDAPSLLEPMLKYIYEDMGLDDLSVLDLRDLDPPAALGPNLIMLFGTARSERHLHICSHRFVRWLKRTEKVNARADGLIGPGELKTKLRRLRKKAKLLGTNTSILPGGDNGISTGWVCVNFATTGGGVNEAASFDESGRFSGFGAPQTGTTVVVQVMTESRRNELDLETLWKNILRKNLEEIQRIKGKKVVDAAEVEAVLSSKIQLPNSASAQQWDAMKRASQQQRYFSTSARRLQAHAGSSESKTGSNAAVSNAAPAEAEDSRPNLTTLRQQISDLQITGTSVSPQVLQNLISAVLLAPPSTGGDAYERLALVDQLSLVADERGTSVLSTEWLVMLIESIVLSPAYGPERRSDSSAHGGARPSTRLGKVLGSLPYPPRFQMARSSGHYEFAYRVMAATGNRKLCIDALRWVYPEMLKEQPQIWPVGSLYSALKSCILVADPAAEQLLRHPPSITNMGTLAQMRLKNREFLRVLREVENLRTHHVTTAVREQRAQALNRFSEKQTPASS
ncbi:ATPase synthesis protein 25 [Cladobotryum mycophilum]|uniref:ATPase synthesis protein 25 n=1 Tax=Cladobotryum mycophilum TaxID=491253 RepID=A0ABR0SGQ0_9HYPO